MFQAAWAGLGALGLGAGRFSRTHVQQILKVTAAGVAVGAFVLPIGWDYPHRPPRTWRELACTYRVAEIMRGGDFLMPDAHGGDACAVLRRLGLDVEPWS